MSKKKMFLCTTLLFAVMFASAQTKPIKVYILGTFHFSQTDSTYNVLETKHQQSIEQLSALIVKQKPDKVFIERMPEFEYENKVDSLYQLYRQGKLRDRKNEIWQVGARVAAALQHPHIYQCDHPGRYGMLHGQIEAYATAHNQLPMLEYKGKGITKPASAMVNDDSILYNTSLLEYLRFLNSDWVQSTSHAAYINLYTQMGNTNVFNYDSNYFIGTALTVDWYRRNIMMYSKMIAQLNYSEHAVFLIVGNDHVPIFRHLFQSNPYFEVVPCYQWLGASAIAPQLSNQKKK